MNDKELNEVLKRATVPEREPDYWERFPGRVIGEIERRTRSASTPSRGSSTSRGSGRTSSAAEGLPSMGLQ